MSEMSDHVKISDKTYEKLCKSCVWVNKESGKVLCPFVKCVKGNLK
ncbi:hypothetical protein KP78_20940 [Jeotgalibacillus soli]|uniref:Uncharacterized protein n=1 Tax=Jeotgalibacillus soli TaxID=889306 RepID=A0A0C2R660_9BACL|nr:hypothetical protein KP78_20940 [Jeotgalibacillus soli]